MGRKRNIFSNTEPMADEPGTPKKRAYNRSGKFSKASKPNIMDDTTPNTKIKLVDQLEPTDLNDPNLTIADMAKANAAKAQPQQPATTQPAQQETHEQFISSGPDQEAEAMKKVAKELGISESTSKSGADYNPMAGDVKARGGHAEIHTDQTIQTEIAEFTPPSGTFAPPPPPTQAPPADTPPPPPLNPGMQNLPPEEARQAAESMVDVIFEVYGLIKVWVGSKVKIDITGNKLRDLLEKNKIGLDIPLPLPNGDTTTFREIAASFDTQVAETFTVSPSFINKVREPMIREFMKRGIGLTDIQKIGVYWAIELLQTGMQALSFRGLANEIIDRQIQIYAKITGQTPPPSATQPPPPTTPESPKETPKAPPTKPGEPTDVTYEMIEPEERDNVAEVVGEKK